MMIRFPIKCLKKVHQCWCSPAYISPYRHSRIPCGGCQDPQHLTVLLGSSMRIYVVHVDTKKLSFHPTKPLVCCLCIATICRVCSKRVRIMDGWMPRISWRGSILMARAGCVGIPGVRYASPLSMHVLQWCGVALGGAKTGAQHCPVCLDGIYVYFV